ncbi:tyrosine-type recombinase/integrase [Catenulispora sp. MAP12-49]|uniref:tyrosine-type recombinase/integrase n=1 Tax=Catenulispora sp. MAP12-49 TaxID=3156302 RepID=UPI003518D444
MHALIAAPSFDPLYRHDVINVPGDHPFYGWHCQVAGCGRAQSENRDFCSGHDVEWLAWRRGGGNIVEFKEDAQPLPARSNPTVVPCSICPEIPATGSDGLCYLHAQRLASWRKARRQAGRESDLSSWVVTQKPFPGFGTCQVATCPVLADTPLRLCRRHVYRYQREGVPGGARLPVGWTPAMLQRGLAVLVQYDDEQAFRRWCSDSRPAARMNGQLSLLGLRPLVKAEIKWAMFRVAQLSSEVRLWPVPWIQHLADACREQDVNSLLDLDVPKLRTTIRPPAREMTKQLRQIYISRDDTKDAGYIDTAHYGVRIAGRGSFIDMSGVTQRWLRDLLWDWIDERLTTNPPRGISTLTVPRQACIELSAFLEAHAPGGGHDPSQLAKKHAVDFVADQRHRAEHGLRSLGIHQTRSTPQPATVTKYMVMRTFSGARHVLRATLDTGQADRIGLGREFVCAIPLATVKPGRRRPFPDEVAQALGDSSNLARLEALDVDDRGLRDIWEILIITGRRSGEVSGLRLDCISRMRNLPMFWHDQTKVGKLDQAIRIPEWLYERIELRQATTTARFVQGHGRPPTHQERAVLALFPSRRANPDGRRSVTNSWFGVSFGKWIDILDIGKFVPHQARHTLATNLLRAGADLVHIKRYLGHVSERMTEHYVHIANTDPRLEDALNAVWVAGPGAAQPGIVLSSSDPMTREQAEALAIDLTRRSTPAEGGFCTFQPVVNGNACPWNMDCHNCDKFVMSGADLIYWHRKREQWRMLAERAPDGPTADYLHSVFEPTARAIEGLEKALGGLGLLEEALALDLRRPQDYFGRAWSLAFRAQDLARHDVELEAEAEYGA